MCVLYRNDLFAGSPAAETVLEEPQKEEAAIAEEGGGEDEEGGGASEEEKKKLKRRESMKAIRAARNARKGSIETELAEALAFIDGLDEDA